MMGTKERHFAPLIHVSLEELVCFRDRNVVTPLAGVRPHRIPCGYQAPPHPLRVSGPTAKCNLD